MSDNGTSRSAPRRGALLWLVGRRRGKCVGEVWIPTPVCAPRALASRHALARNDSALRCGAMWASPPTRSRGVRAKGCPPLRCGTSHPKGICSAALHCRTPSPTERDVEDAVPYRAGRRGRRPLRSGTSRGGAYEGYKERGSRRSLSLYAFFIMRPWAFSGRR